MCDSFNVGRYAEERICVCGDLSTKAIAAPAPCLDVQRAVFEVCTRCSRLIPIDLSAFSYQERLAYLEAVLDGTPLTLHGHNWIWTSLHTRPSVVSAWRREADPLADAALAESTMMAAGATDGFDAPPGVAHQTLLAAMDLPTWADADVCRRGGQVWFLNAPVLGPSLLGLSLIGGYGSNLINETLVAAAGLTGSRDSVHRRLIETLQFVNDVCQPRALERGGRGWRACLDVRMLHARVRMRVAANVPSRAAKVCPFGYGGGRGGEDAGDQNQNQPVSAGDIVATQLAFSLVMLMGAERVGLAWHISDADVGALVHLWGVVGALLGATPAAGASSWAAKGDFIGARRTLESLVVVLSSPGPHTRGLVLATARAAAYRIPLFWSPADHISVATALSGARYAHALGLPSHNDPALQELLDDAAPTTALTSELRYVRTRSGHLAIDAMSVLRSERSWGGAILFFAASSLLQVANAAAVAVARVFQTVQTTTRRNVEPGAVSRGRALLAPMHAWPLLVWILPPWARARLAATNEDALVGYAKRRLRGRALYAF